MTRIATQDDFETWLFDMDDALTEFVSRFPESQRSLLNHTPESLDVVEVWLLKRYADTKSMLKPSEASIVDGAARYVGETFRKTLGGQWQINLTDPKYVYFGLPELRGKSKNSTPECPHTLVTASADRRTGVFIKTVFQNSKPHM